MARRPRYPVRRPGPPVSQRAKGGGSPPIPTSWGPRVPQERLRTRRAKELASSPPHLLFLPLVRASVGVPIRLQS